MKRGKPLARKTALKASKGFSKTKSSLSRKNPAKRKNSLSKTKPIDRTAIPAWFRSLKLGTHGNNPTQKRFWTLISAFTRQRDYKKYGRCVSCEARLSRWQDYHGGHYKPYGASNSYAKYSLLNVHAQCPGCNMALKHSDATVGHAFAKTLVKRYGEDHLDKIEQENNLHRGKKMENAELIRLAEKLVEDNPWFIIP
jgi:hypothetical protein